MIGTHKTNFRCMDVLKRSFETSYIGTSFLEFKLGKASRGCNVNGMGMGEYDFGLDEGQVTF
ncbi:MAG: hypothetical protein ABI142_10925 [Bryocella sp.]